MTFKNSIDLKFLWAQKNRANSITQVYMDGKLVEHPPHIPLRTPGVYFQSPSSPISIALALCCELYGEDLAFQVYPWFSFIVSKFCSPGVKRVTIDLTQFNKIYLSKIEYYDVEATVAWYAESLAKNMSQDRLTARFCVKNVPVTNRFATETNKEIEGILSDYVTRNGRSRLMDHNFKIDTLTYTPSVVAQDALVEVG